MMFFHNSLSNSCQIRAGVWSVFQSVRKTPSLSSPFPSFYSSSTNTIAPVRVCKSSFLLHRKPLLLSSLFSTPYTTLSNFPSSTTTTTKKMLVNLEDYDLEQAKLMEEMCIVTDENDIPIRPETKKNCHLMAEINKGLLHRAFSVFLFNDEGKLLLQQRADEKITFPGFFTNSCCSHPLFLNDEMDDQDLVGSTTNNTTIKDPMGVKKAAQRKLFQELGITKNQVPIDSLKFLTRIHYLAPSDGLWGEHEIDYIFIMKANVTCDLNPNEVKSIKYVSKEELQEIFRTADQKGISLTPWFKLIVETFLYKWWDNLDQLDSFVDLQTIHRL